MKIYVILRTDIGMTCGKMCSQAIHAFDRLLDKLPQSTILMWRIGGELVVILKSGNVDEILSTIERASVLGIPMEMFRDAGHTQVSSGTFTAVAFGPIERNDAQRIDVFSKFKLM